MTERNIFKIAIIVSLAVHLIAIMKLTYSSRHQLFPPVKQVEVIYHQAFAGVLKADVLPRQKAGSDHPPIKQIKQLQLQKVNDQALVKDLTRIEDNFGQQQKLPSDVARLEAKRRISLPAIKSENMKNPLYRTYYEGVRERILTNIEKILHENYDRFAVGQVYLTFVLTSDGHLHGIKLIAERTKATAALQEMSTQSIRDSAPFPPFPPDLKYPELTFNVVIYFEQD